MFTFPLFLLLQFPLIILAAATVQPDCQPIYVRWPRVRLNNQQQQNAGGPSLSFTECQNACSRNKEPTRKGGENNNSSSSLQCSAINHRAGLSPYGQECQIFSREHVQHTDGYMEADDRYTFYWKYCLDTLKSCTGEYAFTFLSDRYMLKGEVSQTKYTKSLEECLAECLNDGQILCRSVSFNRTDGGCHLSEQNQLSKPSAIRVNNNPNYRIDYYENNCYNNSFKFTPICEPGGIRIRVDSRIPYTGALYGLYDFFSCRIEPKEEKQFELLFPYPNLAKNCSDSMRQSGDDILLEVVLSTDGVEPLYFITADDLTYQARCPVPKINGSSRSRDHYELSGGGGGEKQGASINSILEALSSAAAEPNLRRFGTTTSVEERQQKGASSPSTADEKTAANSRETETTTTTTIKPHTKDTFTLLPFYTLATTDRTIGGGGYRESTTRESSVEATTTLSSSTATAKQTVAPIRTTVAKQIRPTTIVVKQQQGGGDDDAGKINSNNFDSTGGGRPAIGGGKFGMEPFFEDDQQWQTSSSPSPSPESSYSSAPTPIPGDSFSPKATTKRSAQTDDNGWEEGRKKFTFSTHFAFPANRILMRTGSGENGGGAEDGRTSTLAQSSSSSTGSSTTTTTNSGTPSSTTGTSSSTVQTSPSTTTSTTTSISSTTSNRPEPPPTTTTSATIRNEFGGPLPAAFGSRPGSSSAQREKIIFEIYHNGQPTEAVVVGSRITLAFTPYFAIPPAHMSISGCQVEPIGSLYEWEKEPLAIIKEGCQADHVGLVCPPQKSDYGIRVTVEAFRYQTTTQVQYTCLVRVCPFAPCPQITCPAVEGCSGDDIVSRTFQLNRAKRNHPPGATPFGNGIRHVLASLQQDGGDGGQQQDLWTGGDANQVVQHRMNNAVQQQLIQLGGDSLIRRRLIVVNSEDELRYYTKTGEVPQIRQGQ